MNQTEEKTISEQLIENEEALKLNPTDAVLIKQHSELLKQKEVEDWLDKVNSIADEKAKELSELFSCEIKVAVYVIEELKDVAVAFIRLPDAKQSFKLLRALGENFENGLELAARSQLIRDADLTARSMQGEGSDPRFMDVNGAYDKKYSDLNLSLMFKMQGLVRPFKDEFKKK